MSPPPAGDRFARGLYTLVWWVAAPLVAIYLLWRSRRQPAYRLHWGERFLGRSAANRSADPAGTCLWVHAVSVGETRAAASLVAALRDRYPTIPILVTHMTPTGRDTALALWGDSVRHAYLAYDLPHAVGSFLAHWRPSIGIVMETEIWPNLLAAAERAGVPMLLVNGRLSPKSLLSALRWPALMRPAARRFSRILAQTVGDAGRLAILTGDGAPIDVVGNLKFDIDAPRPLLALGAQFRKGIAPRRVFLCASTREGEEEALFDAWRAHLPRDVLLVVVPRHPQRFDAVVGAATARNLQVQRRSERQPIDSGTRVWIGDSMGELFAYYAAADVAYVGGSIVPLGGQNLIEGAAVGCPILIGPHTFNFSDVADEAVRVGAALRVSTFDALVETALTLLADDHRRLRMCEAGIGFALAHRGATGRTMDVIDAALGARARISSP